MTADGYPQFTYSNVLFPDDIYDFESIVVSNPGSAGPDDITINAFTAKEKLNGANEDKTWDMVRKHRNDELERSDSGIAEDMPDDMKTKLKTFRQQLRDLPNKMAAAGVDPNIADMMFPMNPLHVDPPTDPADGDASLTPSWKPPAT